MKKIYFLLSIVSLFVSEIILTEHAQAQVTFQKLYGRSDTTFNSLAFSAMQTTDGGYVITGNTTGSATGYNIHLIKTDDHGDLVWTHTYAPGINDEQSGRCVRQTIDGGYIISGYTYNENDDDAFLLKTDGSGNELWFQNFNVDTNNDYLESVRQTADSGFIAAGYTINALGNSDIYLVKTNSAGLLDWSRVFGGPNYESAVSVKQTVDKGYIISGFTNSFGGGSGDIYLVKTDFLGNLMWSKTFGGINYEVGTDIEQTKDTGYIISGITNSFGASSRDFLLVKTDSNANIIWSKTYGGAIVEECWDVKETNDGGYVAVGTANSFGDVLDCYAVKTNSAGDTLWTKTYGGAGYDEGHSVQQTADGGYVFLGFTNSFLPDSGDIYLVKTDGNGKSGCNENNPPTVVTSVVLQTTNAATVFSTPVTVVTNPLLTDNSNCVVTTLCTNVGIDEVSENNAFVIYPNPAHEEFSIAVNKEMRNASVEIFNVMGEMIYRNDLGRDAINRVSTVNLHSGAGIYFVRVANGEKIYTQKLIIE